MSATQTLDIKYFSDKIDKLEYIDGKSDWIDLRAAEDVEFKQGEFKLIPLGIGIRLPASKPTWCPEVPHIRITD